MGYSDNPSDIVSRSFAAADAAHLDRTGFAGSLHLPMHLHFYRAYPGDREALALQLPASMIGKGETVRLASGLVAWIARCVPAAHAAKEGGKRFLDPLQHLLQHMRTNGGILWPTLSFELWQRIGLIVVGHTIRFGVLLTPRWIIEVRMLLTYIPGVFSFLKRGVIQLATARHLPVQCIGLRGRGVQTIFEGFHPSLLSPRPAYSIAEKRCYTIKRDFWLKPHTPHRQGENPCGLRRAKAHSYQQNSE